MTGCCDEEEEEEDEVVDELLLLAQLGCEEDEDDEDGNIEMDEAESEASMRRVRRPCFELLCTNMLSEVANTVFMSIETVWLMATWNRRMSRGFPAFFKQFWLHLRKNFMKNLHYYQGSFINNLEFLFFILSVLGIE